MQLWFANILFDSSLHNSRKGSIYIHKQVIHLILFDSSLYNNHLH